MGDREDALQLARALAVAYTLWRSNRYFKVRGRAVIIYCMKMESRPFLSLYLTL